MAMTSIYTGANGTPTLAVEDTPEGRDAQDILETWKIVTVGRVVDVEIGVRTNLEEFQEIVCRHPYPGRMFSSDGFWPDKTQNCSRRDRHEAENP